MIIIKIFYAIVLIGIGVGIIKYRKTLKGWTGSWLWAERYIGRGGTYFVMILLGLFLIFIGAIYPFGGLDRFGHGGDNVANTTESILNE